MIPGPIWLTVLFVLLTVVVIMCICAAIEHNTTKKTEKRHKPATMETNVKVEEGGPNKLSCNHPRLLASTLLKELIRIGAVPAEMKDLEESQAYDPWAGNPKIYWEEHAHVVALGMRFLLEATEFMPDGCVTEARAARAILKAEKDEEDRKHRESTSRAYYTAVMNASKTIAPSLYNAGAGVNALGVGGPGLSGLAGSVPQSTSPKSGAQTVGNPSVSSGTP